MKLDCVVLVACRRAAMYKVKTTAPKRYRVNPNAAEIEPGATVEVKGALPIPTPPPRR